MSTVRDRIVRALLLDMRSPPTAGGDARTCFQCRAIPLEYVNNRVKGEDVRLRKRKLEQDSAGFTSNDRLLDAKIEKMTVCDSSPLSNRAEIIYIQPEVE